MNKHEVHYLVHEQELLVVRDALLKFRCYLDGAAEFTVITDHDTLPHFFRQHDLSTRQEQWLQVLAPYQRQMDIVYKKGAVNHADALSRRHDMRTHYCYAIGPTTKQNASYTRRIFPWNPGYIMTLNFMRKSKTLMTRINTCLPGNLCLPGWYVNRMDS
jgi:hypothetical protein